LKNKELWQKVKENIANRELTLGPYFSRQLLVDPKHVLFTLSRYKFAAKLLGDAPKLDVLELGCNEGFGSLLLSSFAKKVVAVDFDEKALAWAAANFRIKNLAFKHKDFLKEKIGKFDTVIAIDVIEHVRKSQENIFLKNICDNLKGSGFCIIGTPNITASKYACKASKIGHVNLYDAQRLKNLFLKRFSNVFIFGMNDEVIHTGFYPMCHFMFVLACNKK
jgi:2-polyprenyl-3-methyl-5-hydroxy-6-metoxy-1,4-benzoquinol methylase